LPAGCRKVSNGRLAIEVVVAVARTSNTVDAADDDVCAEGVTGAEGTVWIVGRTDDLRAITGRC